MKTTQQKIKIGFSILIVALVLVGTCSLTGCYGNNTTTPQPSSVLADKATLAGIDANGDGVRDDVAAYIATTYPNSAKQRAALTQYAKVVQSELLDSTDKALSIQHGHESDKAMECMDFTFASFDAFDKASRMLKGIVLNTDARNKAYFMYNDQLGGQNFMATLDSQLASTCAIDPATLPN